MFGSGSAFVGRVEMMVKRTPEELNSVFIKFRVVCCMFGICMPTGESDGLLFRIKYCILEKELCLLVYFV